MNSPSQVCKIFGFLLLLLLLFSSSIFTVQAAGKVTLTSMEKKEEIGRTRINLFFSRLPEFEISSSGQRLDLLLKDVWVSNKLRSLPADETVVEIIFAQKQRDLLTSLLLRQPPQEVISESKNNPPRIELELLWEGDTTARPGLAFRISDMPVRKAGKKARQYQQDSPWNGRWRAFFSEYHTDWKLQLPLRYSLPQLPPLITAVDSPLQPLQQLADEGKWLSLIQQAGSLNSLTAEQQYRRDLLLAEAQLRTDAIAAGLFQLEQLADLVGPDPVRVGYLTAYAQAVGGQPFVAQLTLQQLLSEFTEKEPLIADVYLLAAETAIGSKQYQQALDYLQDEKLNWPEELLPIVELRIADALSGQGKLEDAVAAYRQLGSEEGLFEYYPASCALAAGSAFRRGDYEFAERLYRKLAEQLKDQPGADLVAFAIGVSAYKAGNIDWGVIGLQKATLDWPGTEGGDRAELRLIDHRLITGDDFALAKAATEYGQVGQRASTRLVREEGRFKRALALYLLAEYRESINDLMRFRREFGSSKLRRETDLLLLEQLPIVVKSLLQQGKELEAVVLVEQNRQLLLRGGFSEEFLHDLADSFENLGLYSRASRVLLYLYDGAKNEKQRQPLYLPLARAFFKQGEFAKVSEYADRYLKKYPRGKDSGALFGLLLDAFAKQDRNDELLAWLGRKDRPSSPELEARAAWIYWQLQRWQEVIDCLEKVRRNGAELEVKEMALLAEAYCRLRQNSAAEKIYRQLQTDPDYSSQARYRLAQLLLRQEQRSAALNLLQQLVDEDEGSAWNKLAQDLLIQEKR
mgnify:CR=1 FL=1